MRAGVLALVLVVACGRFRPAPPPTGDDPTRLVAQADELVRNNSPRTARQLYRKVVHEYPGTPAAENALWGLGQAMFTKMIVVVDEDVDVQNIADVTLKALNHIDPERDIQFMLGPVDSLGPA